MSSAHQPNSVDKETLAPEVYPNLIYVNRVLSENLSRLRAAYHGDTFFDSFGADPQSTCRYTGCITAPTQTHIHLHRADAGICMWHDCLRMNLHIHKLKPKTQGTAGGPNCMTPYERVKLVLDDIIDMDTVDETLFFDREPLFDNVFRLLKEEAISIEAKEKSKSERIKAAENAGEEAAREFEQRSAANRAAKAEEKRREREAHDRKRRKLAGRASLRLEMETGNELERHFADVDGLHMLTRQPPETSPTLTQQQRDAQLGVYHERLPEDPMLEQAPDSVTSASLPPVPSAKALGKRKPVKSFSSSSSSPSDIDPDSDANLQADVDSPIGSLFEEMDVDQEDSASLTSQTSTLTEYTEEELDAILSGAEVIEEPSSLPNTPCTLIDIDGPSSNDAMATFELNLAYARHIRNVPPPPGSEITDVMKKEREINRETMARGVQIRRVMTDPSILAKKRKNWDFEIYEDPPEARTAAQRLEDMLDPDYHVDVLQYGS